MTIFIAMTSLPGLLIWGGCSAQGDCGGSLGIVRDNACHLGNARAARRALRSAGGALPDWFGMYASKSHLPDLVLGYLPAGSSRLSSSVC